MVFPESLVKDQIEEGKVYRFYDTVPEGSDAIPGHWHICFKVGGEIVYLLCCTTKEETIDNFIKVNRLDKKTKVHITPTEDNGLLKETFLNCNSVHYCDFEQLVKAVSAGSVTYSGEITEAEYQLIKIGLLSSAVVPQVIKQLLL